MGDITESLDELFESGSSIEKEILEDIFSLENLDRKTELAKPIQWSILSTIRNYLLNHKLTFAASLLKRFTHLSFRYLISKGRKGREEYIRAVEAFAMRMQENKNANLPPTRMM